MPQAGFLFPGWGCNHPRECCFQQLGFETEGARFAFIRDTALGIDQINAVWPAGIGAFGGVAKFVEDRGELYPKLSHARPSYERTLFLAFRAGKEDLIPDVALHLPNVAGVRLGYVDNQKSNPVSILLVELVEGGHLPPERRSGVTAENQDNRLAAAK